MVRCIAWWYHLLSNVYGIRLRSRVNFLLKRKRVKEFMDTLHRLTQPLFFQRKENILVHCCLKFFLRIGLSYQNNTSDYNLERVLEIIWSQHDSQITKIIFLTRCKENIFYPNTNLTNANGYFIPRNTVWSLIMQNLIIVGYFYKSFIMARQFISIIYWDIFLRLNISLNTFKLAILFNISYSCIQNHRCNLVKPNGEK